MALSLTKLSCMVFLRLLKKKESKKELEKGILDH